MKFYAPSAPLSPVLGGQGHPQQDGTRKGGAEGQHLSHENAPPQWVEAAARLRSIPVIC